MARLSQWQQGDAGAMDHLLMQIHPMIYRWALSTATNVDDADDIAQHALITVYRKLGQFRGDAPLGTCLYRRSPPGSLVSATASTRDARRWISAHTQMRKGECTQRTRSRVDRDRLTAVVRQCYNDLPPQQRTAITLVDFDGRTPAEAAQIMELGAATLRANLFKARASIRRRVFSLERALADGFANVAIPTTHASAEEESR